MMELMNTEALSVNAARRREVAVETMRDINASDGLRHAAGLAIVAIGARLSGEVARVEPRPARAQLQPSGDCY